MSFGGGASEERDLLLFVFRVTLPAACGDDSHHARLGDTLRAAGLHERRPRVVPADDATGTEEEHREMWANHSACLKSSSLSVA